MSLSVSLCVAAVYAAATTKVRWDSERVSCADDFVSAEFDDYEDYADFQALLWGVWVCVWT